MRPRGDHWRRPRSATAIRADPVTEIKDPVKEAAKIVSAPKDGAVDGAMSVVSSFAKYIVLYILSFLLIGWTAGLIADVFQFHRDYSLDLAIAASLIWLFLAYGICRLIYKLLNRFRKDNAADRRFNDPNVR
jgi:hypothetical protein